MAAGVASKVVGDGNAGTLTGRFWSSDGTAGGTLSPAPVPVDSSGNEILPATAAQMTTNNTSLGATSETAAASPAATAGLNGIIKGMWTALVAGIGAIGDTAWVSGNGSVIAILKTIAGQALSSVAQAIVPLPTTPVSGLTAAMTATTTTAVTGIGAASGKNNYITGITVGNSHATVGTFVELQDGSGGTTFFTLPAAAVYGGATFTPTTPLKQPTANTALFAKNTTTGANVIVSVVGFQA